MLQSGRSYEKNNDIVKDKVPSSLSKVLSDYLRTFEERLISKTTVKVTRSITILLILILLLAYYTLPFMREGIAFFISAFSILASLMFISFIDQYFNFKKIHQYFMWRKIKKISKSLNTEIKPQGYFFEDAYKKSE